MANKTINQLTLATSVAAADEIEIQKSGESTSKKTPISAVLALESTPRVAQDDAIEAGVGLNADGSYPTLENSWYLRAVDFLEGITDRAGASGALTENIINALRILDAKIHASALSQQNTIYHPVSLIDEARAEIFPLSSSNVRVLSFDDSSVEEYQYNMIMPSNYVADTDVSIRIKWIALNNVGAAADVVWGVEYMWADEGGVVGSGGNYTTTAREPADVSGLIGLKMYETDLGLAEGSGRSAGSALFIRIYRDVNDVDDTLTGDAALVGITLEF